MARRTSAADTVEEPPRRKIGYTGTGSTYTGYIKNYVYNDRLRYREPPFFLDPVLSSWRISRQSERLPPCSTTTTACPLPD